MLHHYLAGLLFLAAPLLATAGPTTENSPWDQAALGLFKDAHRTFSTQAGDDREARFGEAITLINLQPKTDANLDHAVEMLSVIAKTDPVDALGINARYYIARIAQVHRFSPDIPSALNSYRELAAIDSAQPLAQRAVVQLALLELFEPGLSPTEVSTRFERLTARGTRLSEPPVVRDFHLVMGDAAIRFKLGDTIALQNLLAADRAGIARAITQRDTWLRIANLARRAGRQDIAVEYYNRFLQKFPRDSRRLMVKENLSSAR